MRSENLDTEIKSWTDDLPVCQSTGAGYSTNQIYREDGARQEAYKFRDRSFHCKIDENTCLYAIFSGHQGTSIAEFALQRMAAEILLGQLSVRTPEEEVKEVLRQAFISVEKGYLDSIDSLLATKTMLQYEIPEGLSQYEITQKYQHILDQLNSINEELSVGTSVILALIHNSKLYICNVGNCRALLCKNDVNNVLRVIQLSVDHNLYNEDEILRLCQLGLDTHALKQAPLDSTRCIGSFLTKNGYKDCEYLSGAISEPVISQPEIVGAIPIDESCRFIVLMSNGLCKSLQEVYSTESNQVNKEMVQMIVEQFRLQASLMGVSQTVVHKIVQSHHDTYLSQIQENKPFKFKSRNDITLLIRNFNFPMPNDMQKRNSQVRFNPVVREHSHSNSVIYSATDSSSIVNSNTSQYSINTNTSSASDRSSSDGDAGVPFFSNKKVKPYVDFTNYFVMVDEAKRRSVLPSGIDFD